MISEESPVSETEKTEPETEQKIETPIKPSEVIAPDISEPRQEPERVLFTRNMFHGCPSGEDIKLAQQILNMDPETRLRVHGESGTPGHERTSFGNAMKEAVERFQSKYCLFGCRDEEYGIIEAKTREKLQEVYNRNNNPSTLKKG